MRSSNSLTLFQKNNESLQFPYDGDESVAAKIGVVSSMNGEGQIVCESRGAALTTFAILFAILALSNLSKPFHLDPKAGFVFFGVKARGTANALLGPAFGLVLVIYAVGIWRMRRWVLPVGCAYAAYVILNLTLYTLRNSGSQNQPPGLFMLGYTGIAVGISGGSAILLYRRRSQLI
jgi:hypothetical protein